MTFGAAWWFWMAAVNAGAAVFMYAHDLDALGYGCAVCFGICIDAALGLAAEGRWRPVLWRVER
jgi:hypothetical protein